MSSRGKVPVELFASVGGGDQVLLGTVLVPITSADNGAGGLTIDLSHQLTIIRNRMEFYKPGEDDE